MRNRRNQDYLVTQHRFVTIEPIKPKDEGWGVAEVVGAVFLVLVVLAVIGAVAGH